MHIFARALQIVNLLFHSLLKDLTPSAFDIKMGVLTECRDKDGNLKWRDEVRAPRLSWFPNSIKLASWFLFASVTLTTMWFQPLLTPCVYPLARVTTVGLNLLLDSTLKTGASSPVWYVGLIKQVASDGAITSGAATFTSASGTFVSGDIGRYIIVQGAGASGADLYTTISAVGSTTSITLGANAGTTVSGARYAFECRLADTMSSHTSFVESTSYSNSTRVAWTPGSISAGSVDNSASVAAFTINASDYIFGAFLNSNSTKGGTTGSLYGCGVNSSGIARQVANGDTLNVTVTCTATAT
jgi:hypothetical protein